MLILCNFVAAARFEGIGILDLICVALTAEDLRDKLSLGEQEFLVHMGHALNELNFLAKALIATPTTASTDVESIASFMQRLFYSRMIASKSHEINIDIAKFRGKHKDIFLKDRISEAAKKHGNFLKEYGESLATLRNVVGFHNPRKQFAEHSVFDAFDAGYQFEIYLANESGSSLYALSEMPLLYVLGRKLSKGTGSMTVEQTVHFIQEMAVGAMRHVQTLGELIMAILVSKAKGEPFSRNVIAVPAVDYANLSLPFFCTKQSAESAHGQAAPMQGSQVQGQSEGTVWRQTPLFLYGPNMATRRRHGAALGSGTFSDPSALKGIGVTNLFARYTAGYQLIVTPIRATAAALGPPAAASRHPPSQSPARPAPGGSPRSSRP